MYTFSLSLSLSLFQIKILKIPFQSDFFLFFYNVLVNVSFYVLIFRILKYYCLKTFKNKDGIFNHSFLFLLSFVSQLQFNHLISSIYEYRIYLSYRLFQMKG